MQSNWLQRADLFGRWFENSLLVLLFVALISLSGAQIILRNIFSAGLPWADGLIRIIVLWLAVVGAIAASHDAKHIAIEIITRSLPLAIQRYVRSAINIFGATVAIAFAWQSWRFVKDSREWGEVLVTDWPAWIFQLILPVGFTLIAYQFLLAAVLNLSRNTEQA